MTRTNKSILTISALFLVIIVLAITFIRRGHFYDIDLFRSGDGWGYDISHNNKIYIHQPYIPAVEGERPFSDRVSARKTAKLVISKIKDHKIPALTKEEVKGVLGEK